MLIDTVSGVQDTDMLPTLTVWETLQLHASLCLDTEVHTTERHEIITSTLVSMGLAKVRDTKVRKTLASNPIHRFEA
jgi:ABC-type multidrug transport system ATPase subunit